MTSWSRTWPRSSHGARPVHQIISMIKWIRTSKLSIKNSLSLAEELTDQAPEETESEDSGGEAGSPAGGVDSALPGKGAPNHSRLQDTPF